MAKKSKRSVSNKGRLSWDGRLWDQSGAVYERSVDELTRAQAADLVRDQHVQVAISLGAGPLRWLDSSERDSVWRHEIGPNFYDEPGWKPPAHAPGQLPFHAELWRNGEQRVLLVTDRD